MCREWAKFEDGMMLVTGSEKIAEQDIILEVGSRLGKQNGIEKEMFTNDGECAWEVERGLSKGSNVKQ